jgi:hypothetical protein
MAWWSDLFPGLCGQLGQGWVKRARTGFNPLRVMM